MTLVVLAFLAFGFFCFGFVLALLVTAGREVPRI